MQIQKRNMFLKEVFGKRNSTDEGFLRKGCCCDFIISEQTQRMEVACVKESMRDFTKDPRFEGIKPFEKRVWLSSRTMHGEEQKWINDAFETLVEYAGEIIATNAVEPYSISTFEN